MANTLAWNGVQPCVDVTMKIGSNLATTTSQYKVVQMDLTGTVADLTAYGQTLSASSTPYAEVGAFGIIQSYQTANSSEATIRLFGITKVYAGAVITCGSYVGPCQATINAATGGMVTGYAIAQTITGSGMLHRTVLGKALQHSTLTGQAITIFLNPQILF